METSASGSEGVHERSDTAAGFVRDATAADASAVAAIQSECWSHDFDWPTQVLTEFGHHDPEMQWARAVIAPPGPGHRLIVATQGSMVVGFAALAPSGDADAQARDIEIVAWEVRPEFRRRGHGSRLLAAVADHARSIGADTLTIWIATADDPRRNLLREAGFDADGAHRTLQMDNDESDMTLRQIRLVSGI
ncbi:MAG: GNAT family N-acetyltransferase [Candidatus Nanopelagicales bacterium]|jgi:ribosomal protein S18 acetylase RimI-like enzyme